MVLLWLADWPGAALIGHGIEIKHLYKIFGEKAARLVDAVKGGMSKSALMEQHFMAVSSNPETTAVCQDWMVELRGFEPLISGLQAPAH
jgi:hypothetical protein